MNRKVEKILGWIGVGLTLLYMLLFLIGLFMGKGMMSEILLKQGDSSMSPEYLQQSLIIMTVGLIVVAIIAAIGLALVKKSRIFAGVLLLIAAIAGIFLSNFIATILFFIAAIMLFVRKDKAKLEADKAYDREHNYFDAVDNKNTNFKNDQRQPDAGSQRQNDHGNQPLQNDNDVRDSHQTRHDQDGLRHQDHEDVRHNDVEHQHNTNDGFVRDEQRDHHETEHGHEALRKQDGDVSDHDVSRQTRNTKDEPFNKDDVEDPYK